MIAQPDLRDCCSALTCPEVITAAEVNDLQLHQPKRPRRRMPWLRSEDPSKTKDLGFAGLAQAVANKWKQIDGHTRALFEQRARIDKQRYHNELVEWKSRQNQMPRSTAFEPRAHEATNVALPVGKNLDLVSRSTLDNYHHSQSNQHVSVKFGHYSAFHARGLDQPNSWKRVQTGVTFSNSISKRNCEAVHWTRPACTPLQNADTSLASSRLDAKLALLHRRHAQLIAMTEICQQMSPVLHPPSSIRTNGPKLHASSCQPPIGRENRQFDIAPLRGTCPRTRLHQQGTLAKAELVRPPAQMGNASGDRVPFPSNFFPSSCFIPVHASEEDEEQFLSLDPHIGLMSPCEWSDIKE